MIKVGLIIIVNVALWISPTSSLGQTLDYLTNYQILTISPKLSLPIGIKIWFNESGGSIMGLTSWNEGENFASLGIGHFVWRPRTSGSHSHSQDEFPKFIEYAKIHGSKFYIPAWIQDQHCPWQTRKEFIDAQYSPRMLELRTFLQNTIPLQSDYMLSRLNHTLPKMLGHAKVNDQHKIYKNLKSLNTPSGIYALVDFLNFKGAGISNAKLNYHNGSGLLQVVKNMDYAPIGYTTPLQKFVWSAKSALLRKVSNSNSNHQRWLSGWFNRLNTYLDGDYPPPTTINHGALHNLAS